MFANAVSSKDSETASHLWRVLPAVGGSSPTAAQATEPQSSEAEGQALPAEIPVVISLGRPAFSPNQETQSLEFSCHSSCQPRPSSCWHQSPTGPGSGQDAQEAMTKMQESHLCRHSSRHPVAWVAAVFSAAEWEQGVRLPELASLCACCHHPGINGGS